MSNMGLDKFEERAWQKGQEFARKTPFREVKDSEEMYQKALKMRCPARFFDVFKYGAQAVWREQGKIK